MQLITYVVDLAISLPHQDFCILEYGQLLLVKTGLKPALGMLGPSFRLVQKVERPITLRNCNTIMRCCGLDNDQLCRVNENRLGLSLVVDAVEEDVRT